MSIETTIISKASKARKYNVYKAILTLKNGTVITSESVCRDAAINKCYEIARKDDR